MRFNEAIVIPATRVAGVSHKFAEDVIATTLKLEGTMTPELAEALGCLTVLYAGDIPRDGFSKINLETGCDSFQAKLVPNGMEKHALSIIGELADSFVVTRENEELLVEYKLHYHGDAHGPLVYLERIGKGAGTYTITPLQQDLMAKNASPSVTVAAERQEILQ